MGRESASPFLDFVVDFFFILQVRKHPANTSNMRHKESIKNEGATDGAQRVKKKKKMEQNKPRS